MNWLAGFLQKKSIIQLKSGKSFEPNLHDFEGFQPLKIRGECIRKKRREHSRWSLVDEWFFESPRFLKAAS